MKRYEDLERDLGYTFTDSRLLKKALTHSSHAHEQDPEGGDNEQLEFLGDSVLGFVASDLLYRSQPGLSEGQLSKLKGFLVSSANLVKYAEQLRIGEFLHLGRGEEKTGGRNKQALLVDAFEAILGAIYLDGGLEAARDMVARFLEPQIRNIGDAVQQVTDFKTAFQEMLQNRQAGPAEYAVKSESGPDHQKVFVVEVALDGKCIARGLGLTRKAAEQAAAKNALSKVTSI